MKITIIGPGAMGCLFAAFLAEAKQEVLLLDYRPERVELLKQNGLFVEGISGEHWVKVRISASPADAADSELVLVCVKAYHTRTAADSLAAHLAPEARILTLQNGVGNVEILSEVCGPERVWAGITSQGATAFEPGHVRHAGTGQTIIGAASGPGQEDRLAEAADLFSQAGFAANVEARVEPLIWSKLIVNAGINPLTALTRLKNGQLLHYPGTERLMEAAVREAVAVVKAMGLAPVFPVPIEHVKSVARATAGNIASMRQDVL
ncbi:MAG: 2-dehydropantoate 2-reductase, partial [Deltaproteobacteria bacterium]|nr:2-dehydropantoate 2-reductase [Deltaproteobacteria bacterium]